MLVTMHLALPSDSPGATARPCRHITRWPTTDLRAATRTTWGSTRWGRARRS